MFWVTDLWENTAIGAPASPSPTSLHYDGWSRLLELMDIWIYEYAWQCTTEPASRDWMASVCHPPLLLLVYPLHSHLIYTRLLWRCQAGGEKVFLGCRRVWMMVWMWTNWQQLHNAEGGTGPNGECDIECWVHVEWAACGTPDYKSPGCAPGFFSVQCWLSHLLSLSVSTWCWTEPYFADWGQGVGVVVRSGEERGYNCNAYWQLKEFQSHSDIY